MTIRAFRRRGPGYLPTAQVFDVLRREGMTRSEVARQVRVTVDELYAAIFGLVVTRRRARGRPSYGSFSEFRRRSAR